MKRIAILIVLVASTLVSMAQNKLGTWSVIPHVGVSISSLLGGSGIYEVADNEVVEVKPYASLGFIGGADVMYQASDVVGSTCKPGSTTFSTRQTTTRTTGACSHDLF